MSPRHAQTSTRPASFWVGVSLAVVIVVAVAGWLVAVRIGNADEVKTANSTASPTSSASSAATTAPPSGTTFAADKPAAQQGAKPCIDLRILASLENADLVSDLGAAYTAQPRSVGGRCVTVEVTKQKSGDAAIAAANGFAATADGKQPTVWLPDASAWLAVARGRAGANSPVVPAEGVSVARSAVVLGMPVALADALGWTDKAPSWSTIFAATANKKIFTDLGHPEWGGFKLGKTSPLVATSGLYGLLASYDAAAGKWAGLTVGEVRSPDVLAKVKKSELSISHYMATPEHFLWHARQADDEGSVADFLSGVIVDEKSIWDYNRGISSNDGITTAQEAPPKEKLVPIYPSDGIYSTDSPAVVIDGSWVDAAHQAAAKDFIAFATSVAGQASVRHSGYRDLNGVADQTVAALGGYAASPKPLVAPGPAVLNAVQASFPSVRKRARVTFLLDVSRSMSNPLPGGASKLDGAKSAVEAAMNYFTGEDQVGLAAFSNYNNGPVVPGLVTPIGPFATNRSQLEAALAKLTPVSQTPLYAALGQVADQMSQQWQPDLINAVVLLSDGKNDSTQPGSLAELAAQLEMMHHTTPLLVFTLAYGADADTASLQLIARSSGAHFYDASDPTTLASVLGDLVTSF